MARIMAMSGFDAAHPLWEFTLVEDLADGGAALVMKLHHSLTDGIGGMQLLFALFDTCSGAHPPKVRTPRTSQRTSRRNSRARVRVQSIHGGRKVLGFARHQAAGVFPSMWRSGRHPVRSSRDAVEMMRSVGRTVAPVSSTLSPLMTRRSLGRRLSMLEVALDDLKRASAVGGGSCQRRVHGGGHRGLPAIPRASRPARRRTAGDASHQHPHARGPRRSGTGSPSHVSRYPSASSTQWLGSGPSGERCRAARNERSVPRSNTIAGVLNLLPPSAVGSMLKHVDFLASNVPGIGFPVYLAGARMTGYVPFGPTIGAAVNITLLSYDGTCEVGVTVDTAAVPDIEVFMACLAAGFQEVLALAGPDLKVVL